MNSGLWLLLLGILGLFTYLIVRRSVENLTRTPVWLLWLVMMTPAFIWTGWLLLNGSQGQQPPLALMLGPFLICPLLYWLLLLLGRPTPPVPANPQTAPDDAVVPNGEVKMALRPINREEEATLQACFPWSVYYLQNVEYRPQALICRGQLRASPEVAYQTISENVAAQFGDRFLVVFQEGLNGKPFFALVPNPQYKTDGSPDVRPLRRPGLAAVLLFVTLITTTFAGVELGLTGAPPTRLDWPVLASGLPYALSIMAILGVHELAHYLTAVHYRIRATYPYFIPIPPAGLFPFGTFGAFIQMRSPVPNRKALFDVGISGPLAGFVMTVPILLWGLSQSRVTELTAASSILNFESFNPSASILLALFSKLALGGQLTAESALRLHPVAIAGCLGVIVTALNLMPVGQLDGGHIVHAMYGQRMGALIGQVSRLLVLGLSLVRQEFLLWALLLLFMPAMDEPALNDVSELDDRRDLLGLLSLVLLVLIVLPAPPVLTRLLF